MDIESKRWRIKRIPGGLPQIIQKATGVRRSLHNDEVPHPDKLAAMSETQFDALMRKLFHSLK